MYRKYYGASRDSFCPQSSTGGCMLLTFLQYESLLYVENSQLFQISFVNSSITFFITDRSLFMAGVTPKRNDPTIKKSNVFLPNPPLAKKLYKKLYSSHILWRHHLPLDKSENDQDSDSD